MVLSPQQSQALAALALVPGAGLAATVLGTAAGLLSGSSEPRVSIPEDQYGRGGVGWGVETLPAHRRGLVALEDPWGWQYRGAGSQAISFELLNADKRKVPGWPTPSPPPHFTQSVTSGPSYDAHLERELGREAAVRGGIDRLHGSSILLYVGAGRYRRIDVASASWWKAACPGATGCTVEYAKTFMEPIIDAQRALPETATPYLRSYDLRPWEGRGNGEWQTYQESITPSGGASTLLPEGPNLYPLELWRNLPSTAAARESWNARRAQQLTDHAIEVVEWQAWKTQAQQAANLEALQATASNAVEAAWAASGGELGLDFEDPADVALLVDALNAQFGLTSQPTATPDTLQFTLGEPASSSSSSSSGELELDNRSTLLVAAGAVLLLLVSIR